MKFVDEASIRVDAGKGGDGCLSFRREKYIEKGGPDGGDGGRGGSIFLTGDRALNTLVDFRYRPEYRGEKGEQGKGSDRTGAAGTDMLIKVPCGTSIFDDDTDEYLGDINAVGETLLVAAGGRHGLGNARFKSSTNRAPRQTTPGEPGEQRQLRLELKLIADVGLLGMPNAGKSTLISAVSDARPRIADYPFTTLIPNLGMVRVDTSSSFVIADIPGLIAGAAEGTGLGVQFLKHLSRTRLLLHLLDLMPSDGSNPVDNCKLIERELARYSEGIAEKPRWLVITKLDLLPEIEAREKAAEIVAALDTKHYFAISAISGAGLPALLQGISQHLTDHDKDPGKHPADGVDQPDERESLIRQEIHAYSTKQRMTRKLRRTQHSEEQASMSPSDVKVRYKP